MSPKLYPHPQGVSGKVTEFGNKGFVVCGRLKVLKGALQQ